MREARGAESFVPRKTEKRNGFRGKNLSGRWSDGGEAVSLPSAGGKRQGQTDVKPIEVPRSDDLRKRG